MDWLRAVAFSLTLACAGSVLAADAPKVVATQPVVSGEDAKSLTVPAQPAPLIGVQQNFTSPVTAKNDARDWPAELVAVTAVAAAIIALCQLFVFRRQLNAMEKTWDEAARATATADANAKTAQESFETSSRAYVHFTFVQLALLENSQDGSKTWQLRPVWKNFGKLPAKQVRAWYWYVIRDAELPENFDFSKPASVVCTLSIIPPGAELISVPNSLLAGVQLYRGLRSADGQTKLHVYMWGAMTYNDGFSHTPERTTTFCVHGYALTIDPENPPEVPYPQSPLVTEFYRENNSVT